MRFLSPQVGAIGLVLTAALGCQPSPPPAPHPQIPGIKVVNTIPNSLSGETWQDSEPFLAVHPSDPQILSASAFTRNPGASASGTAPIFISQDGGDSWTLQNIVPSEVMTSDITHAFDANGGDLYGGILRRPGSLLLNALFTTDLLSPVTMTVQTSRSSVDQPFVQATSPDATTDRIYLGNNDFDVAPQTATVDVSLDGGGTWRSVRIEPRSTGGQDGPSIRPTSANDGTVYAAYFGWRSFVNDVASSDVVVVRDDDGGAGSSPFRDLTGPDGLPGAKVVRNVSIPFSNAPTLGQERIGSTLTIAVDPNNSARVLLRGEQEYKPLGTLLVERGVCDMPTVQQALEMQEGNGRS